jgi:uncharacterized membrane protein
MASKVRLLAIGLDLALILWVIAWQLAADGSALRLLLGIALTLPLSAPFPGLWRGNRRTFAWTTLCVIPYFVIGLTEAVAQPGSRAWPATCLALALTLFVTLIGYLRLSRDPLAVSLPVGE